MFKKPSVSLYFDKRRMRDGYCSIKYVVYYRGKQKEYATGIEITNDEAEFLREFKGGITGRFKDSKRELWNQVYADSYIDQNTGHEKEGLLFKAKKIIAKIEDYFTFEIFARTLAGDFVPEDTTPTDADMIVALMTRGKALREQGDISNGSLHESTAASLRRYAVYAKLAKTPEAATLPIMIITPLFLRNYEKWMLQFGKAPKFKVDGKRRTSTEVAMAKEKVVKESPASITTVSIYTRYIRKIWNDAKSENDKFLASYPFANKSKKGYKIANVLNTKKALNKEQIADIFEYACEYGSSRQKYRDMWLLVYMCNGINIMDLCKLRNKDYIPSSGLIEFYRDKTFETKRKDVAKITIYLLPEAEQIIEQWRSDDRDPDDHLFDFLKTSADPEEEKKVVNQVTWNINRHMRLIAKDLKFNFPVRVYEARHSNATALMNAGAPLKFIQDSYGHGSPLTTQKYLSSFEDENAAKYVASVIPARVREAVKVQIESTSKEESQVVE
ncbi:tyrosine-type recombinase/integrase [Dyadobacter sp. CY323]|uniref:tyrosine-type recombinase/integrase n=1 Tax=Dyadobacter sp. CY323 TaxID=2907302 RepID=UPI001F1BA8A1|nr:tyrosine-type recombinase/integrase [Dyadobacter sp. CY323]MCE6992124.1 tyrosine-type recombinase/integrase [Dyadobacter sp. CY323]